MGSQQSRGLGRSYLGGKWVLEPGALGLTLGCTCWGGLSLQTGTRDSSQVVLGRAVWMAEPRAAVSSFSQTPQASQEPLGSSITAHLDKAAGGYRLDPVNVRRMFLPTQ